MEKREKKQVFSEIHFYVVLTFDGFHLLLDEHDIRSVEVVEDVQTQVEKEESSIGVVGWLSYGEEQYPVFHLSTDLQLLPEPPDDKRFCVLIQTEGEEAVFGIMCDALTQLEPGHILYLQPIPEPCHLPHTPLTQLAVYDESVAYVTTADNLVSYISAWGETRMVEVETELESA